MRKRRPVPHCPESGQFSFRFNLSECCKIRADYDGGESSSALAVKYGASSFTIRQAVQRAGGTLRDLSECITLAKAKDGLTDYEKLRVVALYKDGMPASGILRVFPRHDQRTINDILTSHGVRLRTASDLHRRFGLNESAFDRVTPDSLYWAGFLMGDGNVFRPTFGQALLSVCITESDLAHLEKLKVFLCTDKPIQHRPAKSGDTKTGPMVVLQVSSNRICRSLAKYGIVPRKTWTAKPTPITKGPDWVRGLVDADGCVCWARSHGGRRPQIGLCGTFDIVKQFTDYCRAVVGYAGQPHRGRGCWFASLCARRAARMIRHLYCRPGPALDRKARTAREILAHPRYANDEPFGHFITANGITKSLADWSRETGLHHVTIINRIRRGWTEESAVLTPHLRKQTRFPK